MKPFNLENRPKIESGFKVPDGFFETFSKEVLSKTAAVEKPAVPLFKKRRNWLFASAAVLAVGIMIPLASRYATKDQAIDDAEVEHYLAYQSGISQYDLINMLDDEDIEAIEADLDVDDAVLETVLSENSNLENYLTEQP
ncbi:MAG TPA: hypothetical protein VFR70_10420 [Flavobacterium sp.]|nr:hypothetical protein [Flavobacterium sp.]